ncbi:MAG: F0F1 ATP synthase subunit B [Candidatus Margulisiibacteriota bacterium]
MDSLISTFHLDIKLLIAQVINFAIVFAVLYFFALKPLLKVMAERTGKIEQSLADAKKIEENLSRAANERQEIVSAAKKEAGAILERVSVEAEEKREEMAAKTKEEIGQIINKEKERMRLEKAETLKEIKAEVADLVVASVEKLLDKKMNSKDDAEMIRKALKNTK